MRNILLSILFAVSLMGCAETPKHFVEPSAPTPVNLALTPPPPTQEAALKPLSPKELETIQIKNQEVRIKEKTEFLDRWTKEMIEHINEALSKLEAAPTYNFFVWAPKDLWMHGEYRSLLIKRLSDAFVAVGWSDIGIEFHPGDLATIYLKYP